jgi:hypothetical protein
MMRSTRLRLVAILHLTVIVVPMADAGEVWGRVKSVDTRFRKVTIHHLGAYDSAEIRVGPDTEFRFSDGVVLKRVALRSLIGRPIFATVEDVAGGYARKIWVLSEVPLSSGQAAPRSDR